MKIVLDEIMTSDVKPFCRMDENVTSVLIKFQEFSHFGVGLTVEINIPSVRYRHKNHQMVVCQSHLLNLW